MIEIFRRDKFNKYRQKLNRRHQFKAPAMPIFA